MSVKLAIFHIQKMDSDSEEEANKNVIDYLSFYLKDFTVKTLRVSDHKWKMMMDFDSNKSFVNGFMNENHPQVQCYQLWTLI